MTLNPCPVPELGSLVIPFPLGWDFQYQDQCPVEGSGPNKEFALISFSEASPNAEQDELRGHIAGSVSFIKEMVLAVAAERGTPHGELSVLLEKGGRTIYAMASTTDSGGIKGYFLQYVCVSPVSQHFINIGGQGAIDEAKANWDDIMRRSTWAHEA